MNKIWKGVCSIIMAVLLTLVSFPALSSESTQIMDQLADDFKVASGVVVMCAGDDVIIDLDATQGLVEGDLVTVVEPGDPIVHPDTAEVLGRLEQVKSVLQVTHVGSGYSQSQPVGKAAPVQRGDVVRRYEKLSAVFWDYTENGEQLFAELKKRLSRMNWQGYHAAQHSRPSSPSLPEQAAGQVYFILEGQKLTVRGPDFELIHAYALNGASVEMAPAAPVYHGPTGLVRGTRQPEPEIFNVANVVNVRCQTDFSGTISSLALGDFDGNRQDEVAIAFSERFEIGRLQGGEYQHLADYAQGKATKIVSLDAIDLDHDGKDELLVTSVRSGQLVSRIATFADGAIAVQRIPLPWYFRVVDLPGEGRVLLAQCMGTSDQDFDGPLFRVNYSDGHLSKGAVLTTPWPISLYGFIPFATAQGETLYAYLSLNDTLQVLNARGQVLWESMETYGGSETYFETGAGSRAGERRRVPIKAHLESGGDGEILVTVNLGARSMTGIKKFVQGSVVALKWDGNSLREVWHTQLQSGYLADFRQMATEGEHANLLSAMKVTSGDFWGEDSGLSKLVVFGL